MMKNITEITIHTNDHADSFAEEITAFMTGEHSSENNILEVMEIAEDFNKDENIPKNMKNAFQGNMTEFSDCYNFTQYYELVSTPGWYNHGMNGIFQDIPENDEIALKDYKQKSIEYAYKMHSGEVLQKELDEINNTTEVIKYSVEMGFKLVFEKNLSPEEIAFLEMRAKRFTSLNNIQILSMEVEYQEVTTSIVSKKRTII